MNTNNKNIAFLSGDEALAQGAYEVGLKVACSYPGTPATEILEYLAKCDGVDTQWSVNEKVAFEVAMGASVSGVRSLYASKHVGVNVAMDPLMTSAYMGVNGGFVVVTADDPGLHSSQNEQDNRLLAKVAKVPLLEPSSPREANEFIRQAFEISEKFDTPVLVRLTMRVAHTKENVVRGERNEVPAKEFKINPAKYVMVPGHAYKRHIELEKRLEALKEFAETTPLNRVEMKSGDIGFITSSVSYLYVKEIFPEASVLKLGFSYPMPERKIREFAAQVKELYVIEELEPFIEEYVRMLGIPFKAKHPSYRIGELRPELLQSVVKGEAKVETPSTARKPVLCPGCPHRPVFWTLKRAKATVAGDIGCYTLGSLAPLSALHTCLDMGSGVTFFEGLQKGLGKNVVGVIGDSTFVHSGITGLVNAAYNKAKGLLIILDNGTTAMTGSQPNPSTGVTIRGEKTKRLDLEALCRVCGADNVDVVNPYDLKALDEIVKKRMSEDALSVLITRFPCQIIEKTRFAMPSYEKEKCKKCGMCLSIDCPALTKNEDGTVALNPVFCTGCNLCVATCKFGGLTKNEK